MAANLPNVLQTVIWDPYIRIVHDGKMHNFAYLHIFYVFSSASRLSAGIHPF